VIKETVVDATVTIIGLGVVGIGIWVGTVDSDLDHKVDDSDFARVEQQVESLGEDMDEVKDDLKELRDDNKEILEILRDR
tara:strand:+ start:264 stop:503 length:240 start_codon:yes stop_codon:yes gene_type:complete